MWSNSRSISVLLVLIMQPILMGTASLLNFSGELFNSWTPPGHIQSLNNGDQLQLRLDQLSGGGLGSLKKYMFGNFSVQMKVAPGDSAGTVTAFYLSSGTQNRDELDFEFLGNVTGEPYLLQTNIFTNGIGYKEQRISLWFDPTADFHTYSVSWTKQQVIFSVDGRQIRVFANNEAFGQLYVDKQPMHVFFSIWNGDDWATRGGLVKINWEAAPFVAYYQNFQTDGCIVTGDAASCMQKQASTEATVVDLAGLQWVQTNAMMYDYCADKARYPVEPAECTVKLVP